MVHAPAFKVGLHSSSAFRDSDISTSSRNGERQEVDYSLDTEFSYSTSEGSAEPMIASILDKLDRLGDEHPHKLLYSYIDLNGNPIEGYTYESFLHRTKVIAGHLRKEHRFAAQDRLLLAYPPGLEMICAFFGCVRAGLIPVPVYPPSSHGFQGALYKMVHIAKDCQAAGILTSKDYHGSLQDKSGQKRSLGLRSRRRLHFRSSVDRNGRLHR